MRIQPQRFADMQTCPAPRRPMTRFPIRSETPTVGKCNVSLICRRFRSPWYGLSFADGTFPSAAGHVALPKNNNNNKIKIKITTFLADMQPFLLPDVLEDLRSPANLRYQARSLLAQMDKRGIGTLSFVRASSEPVMFDAFRRESKIA